MQRELFKVRVQIISTITKTTSEKLKYRFCNLNVELAAILTDQMFNFQIRSRRDRSLLTVFSCYLNVFFLLLVIQFLFIEKADSQCFNWFETEIRQNWFKITRF